jgi:benzaldehyde dehydrogenase (NAD)
MSHASNSHVWNACIYSNRWQSAIGGTAYVTEPATGERIGTIGAGSAEDIDRAVLSATKAQREWAEMPFDQRRRNHARGRPAPDF